MEPYAEYRVLCGYALARAELIDSRLMTSADVDRALVDHRTPEGRPRWAWVLANIRKIEPFKVKGSQGWFTVNMPETQSTPA